MEKNKYFLFEYGGNMLSRQSWTKKDISEFNNYLVSIKKPEKIDFTKRVVNTNMEVLAIPNPTSQLIAKEIAKR